MNAKNPWICNVELNRCIEVCTTSIIYLPMSRGFSDLILSRVPFATSTPRTCVWLEQVLNLQGLPPYSLFSPFSHSHHSCRSRHLLLDVSLKLVLGLARPLCHGRLLHRVSFLYFANHEFVTCESSWVHDATDKMQLACHPKPRNAIRRPSVQSSLSQWHPWSLNASLNIVQCLKMPSRVPQLPQPLFTKGQIDVALQSQPGLHIADTWPSC